MVIMGRYFNWEKTVPSDKLMTDVVLINHLTSLGFNHIVKVTEQLDIGETLKNHPEITDFTNEEWSGFFHHMTNTYYLFFKDEDDAMAAKLRWS